MSNMSTRLTEAPLWCSGFRPFYILAALYGPLVILIWPLAWLQPLLSSLPQPMYLWHGHEMVFGFSTAIVAGFILTALPGWAYTEEIQGSRLVLLTLVWVAGRIVFWWSADLPSILVMVVDVSFFFLLALFVTPGLLRVEQKIYLLLLPILAGFFIANVMYHEAVIAMDVVAAQKALELSVYALMVLFTCVGGFLTPVFTGNELRDRGRGKEASFSRSFETVAVLSVVLYAATGYMDTAPAVSGAAAIVAFVVHAVRMALWKGWRVVDIPIVFVMHMGYLWLLIAFAARAFEDLSAVETRSIALHAFTIGAFGLMKIGLMTRVALKHTGRAVEPRGLMVATFWAMFGAALLRLAASLFPQYTMLLDGSAVVWVLCLLMYFAHYGAMMWRPSLPR